MVQFNSQPDGNTQVLSNVSVEDAEVVSLNADDLDVEELEHRLELMAPTEVPCVAVVSWEF